MRKERTFLQEFLVNFALVYSFILGTTLIFYSMIRGLFHFNYYILMLSIFLVYLFFWIRDKWVNLDEGRTKITN